MQQRQGTISRYVLSLRIHQTTSSSSRQSREMPNILHKRSCHKSEFNGPNIDPTTLITQYRSVLFTRTFRSECRRLGLIPGQCLCVCNVKYLSSRENVDCDDAIQTGVGCVECLGETNMLIKYFLNTTSS